MTELSPFIDVQWLNIFGLHKENVLEYFSTSPFYDCSSDNHIIFTQRISPDKLLELTGIQFIVDDKAMHPPELFVIKKIRRKSPKSFDILQIYYCLDGTIYLAPTFFDLMRSRTIKGSYYLLQSFQNLSKHTLYTAERGQVFVDPIEDNPPPSSSGDMATTDWTGKDDASITSHGTNNNPNLRQQSHAKFLIRDFPPMKSVFADMSSAEFWENGDIDTNQPTMAPPSVVL